MGLTALACVAAAQLKQVMRRTNKHKEGQCSDSRKIKHTNVGTENKKLRCFGPYWNREK